MPLLLAGAAASLLAAGVGAQPSSCPGPAPEQQALGPVPAPAERIYAQEVISRTGEALAAVAGNREAEAEIHALRASILAALECDAAAASSLTEALRREPTVSRTYALASLAARRLDGPVPLFEVLTAASRHMPEARRPDFHLIFTVDDVLWLARALRIAGDDARRAALSAAVVSVGWPGENDPIAGDIFRMDMVDRHLAAGDRAEAVRVAGTVFGPEAVQMLATQRRYAGLSQAWERPAEAIAEAWSRHDRTTREALTAQPGNPRYLHQRARLLLALGRDAEVAELLAPAAAAPEESYAEPTGRLILEDATWALLAAGRGEEAVALSARLAAIELAADARNTAAAARHVYLLAQAGRPRESVTFAEELLRRRDEHLTDYARSWVRSHLSCALSGLGRIADAEMQVDALMAGGDSSAALRALLCANRTEDAEILLVRRLRDGDGLALQALQDWRRGGADAGPAAVLYDRLRALRSRPAVAAAVERAGRIVQIPARRVAPEVF